ncbi:MULTISPECIES: SRPBCC family protein [unclassified Caballeronia]|uniref:SRPBCC family protein n=1 Tax=unclassified Caballeronia TaxID=2646786 RepID=UPI001F165BF4|nr:MULTISPECIES: SRPBCC family protein [unclassified Caballeronia]MCE4547301.1 SRPBCC family protein [Caballeronia sp. PC1]MCE4575284.1 SRPBCC family protein [Caballeronia sp. CLC5]
MSRTFKHSFGLDYPAEQVWRVAGSFGTLEAISSGTDTCTLHDGGRVRQLTAGSAILWERLLSFSESDRTLSYKIFDTKSLSGPYGVGYVGTLSVEPTGARTCKFVYQGTFEVQPGFTDDQASDAVRAFGEDCVRGIGRFLANQSQAASI